jgi:hypothetical protein
MESGMKHKFKGYWELAPKLRNLGDIHLRVGRAYWLRQEASYIDVDYPRGTRVIFVGWRHAAWIGGRGGCRLPYFKFPDGRVRATLPHSTTLSTKALDKKPKCAKV